MLTRSSNFLCTFVPFRLIYHTNYLMKILEVLIKENDSLLNFYLIQKGVVFL